MFPQYLSPPLACNLAELVVRSGTFQEGDFTFSSGIKSPLKIETSILESSENFQIHRDLSEAMYIMLQKLDIRPEVVVGVIRGGVSFAQDLSYFLNRPCVARLGPKRDEGRQKQVQGFIPRGAGVVVIEDIVTFGTNSIQCTLDLRRNDTANVLGVISVYDHGFPQAVEKFEQYNIPHWSLLQFVDIMNELKRNGEDVSEFEEWHALVSDGYKPVRDTVPMYV